MSAAAAVAKSRLETLDHLRGFFIVVIIIDHLSRWPSIWGLITGKALLWVTAAEGFVAISGLLVGYVRGFKNRDLPFKEVTRRIWARAGLLYVWSIIATVAYVAFLWYVPLQGGAPGLPIPKGEWLTLIIDAVTLQNTWVWVYFLSLYALFLAAAPLAVWLLRRNLAPLVVLISFGLLVLGWQLQNEALQWQFLFFIPVVAGFYLEPILNWWRGHSRTIRRLVAGSVIGMTLATIGLSVITTFYPWLLPTIAAPLNALFAKDTISLWRAAVAFLWFIGFIFLFWHFRHFLHRRLAWLLVPIGTHSLTAYILHGVALIIISALTVSGSNIVINTLLGALAVMLVWGMLKIPHINRVIPR